MALRNELRRQGDLLFKNRSYLPLLILFVGLYLYVTLDGATMPFQGVRQQVYELACLGVALIGLGIRVICVGYSADNTSGRNTTVGQLADTINTKGFYAMCRHPLYLGNFLMWLGLAGFTQNLWFLVAFVGLYWLYYERIMFAEEEFLIGKFGDAYLAYSDQVPAFIPRLGNWSTPDLTFSWRKVIRQEKAGILNLFLVILLFRVAREYYVQGAADVEAYWIYGLAASVAWYAVVKLVQLTTKVLATDR